ncbi:syntaxin-22 [Ziziphus jujuba]|uniref:Syntaxin-22 n=1 Tax=Ziziphus jujuba TaxID=326968 RepID=A0A6P4AXF3_ZIZJJ|nr:syntaxin-22 [Ziziphus jujuba]
MSFQDLERNAGQRKPSSSSSSSSSSPAQAVAAGIFQINTAVVSFRRLVDAIGTVKDTPDHRQKLHNARQRILELVKETSANLKSLSQLDRDSHVNQNKKIEDAKLAKDFQTTLHEFQKLQQLASQRESSYIPSSSSSSAAATSTAQHLESAVDQDQERQPFLMQQKRQGVVLLDNEIAFNETIIEEREQGIKEIQEQIGQANDIFKDLAVLIHEQGVVIDDIQSNIDSSSAATTEARVQLAKASKSVKSKCSWCWWVVAIVAVVLIIFLIVLIL